MKIIIYQHTEAPIVLDHVTNISESNEGDTVTIYDAQDGRMEFQMEDIMKFEGTDGDE